MAKWKNFEENACSLLSEQFGALGILFAIEGGTNSHAQDILASCNGKTFYIEAKLSPCQSGQIVLLLNDEEQYTFSQESVFQQNPYLDEIIEHVNNNIVLYGSVGTRSLKINIESEVAFNWIINHYKIDKKSEWLISSSAEQKLTTQNTLLTPIEQIKDFFNVEVVMRRKKSGTRDLPQKEKEIFESLYLKTFGQEIDVVFQNSQSIIQVAQTPHTLYIGDSYFLSQNSENGLNYRVKKRSSCNNINILFCLVLKNATFQSNEFKKYCQSFFL